MSGHSKWSNIKYRKSRKDNYKNKLFTKLTNNIVNSIVYGSNPDNNNKLKLAINNALSNNMSKNTINKSILRGKKIFNKNIINNITIIYYKFINNFNIIIIIECIINNNENLIKNKLINFFLKKKFFLSNNKSIIYNFKKILELTYRNKDKIFNEEDILNFGINNNVDDIIILSSNEIKIIIDNKYWLSMHNNLIIKGYKLILKKIIFLPLNIIYVYNKYYEEINNILNKIKKYKFIKNIYFNFTLKK